MIFKWDALCMCVAWISICSLIGCARPAVREETSLVRSDEARTRMLLNTVRNINRNAPDSLSSRFSVEGISGKKRFGSLGELIFNKNPRLMRILLVDTVFKSPLTTIVQEGDGLTLYFPGDKSLFLDSVRSMKIKNYTNLDIDLKLLYPLIIGQIPLLENYSVKHGLSKEEGRDTGKQGSFLILENSEFFETISFINDVPDKILFLRKDMRWKIELYLERATKADGVLYYKRIRLNLVSSGDKLSFSFNEVVFNQPVDARAVLALPDKRGLKIVDMTGR